jgi:hypothetical protein
LFYIFDAEDEGSAKVLHEIQIVFNKDSYAFGLSDSNDFSLDDFIRPLDEGETSAAAIQIRSLYPREIDIWYDDKKGKSSVSSFSYLHTL